MFGKSLKAIQAEADQIIRVWSANPAFSLGEITLAAFRSTVADFTNARSATQDLRAQLAKSIQKTTDLTATVSDLVVRGRSAMRGVFGAGSTQYSEVGGIRRTQRRSREAPAVTETAKT
jgi:hypothetical protein